MWRSEEAKAAAHELSRRLADISYEFKTAQLGFDGSGIQMYAIHQLETVQRILLAEQREFVKREWVEEPVSTPGDTTRYPRGRDDLENTRYQIDPIWPRPESLPALQEPTWAVCPVCGVSFEHLKLPHGHTFRDDGTADEEKPVTVNDLASAFHRLTVKEPVARFQSALTPDDIDWLRRMRIGLGV